MAYFASANDFLESGGFSQTIPADSTSPAAENPAATLPTGGLLLIPFSFIVLSWLLVFLMRFEFWKSLNKRSQNAKKLQQSPCLSCRFFSNNPYLKCSVHPTQALTQEANQCPDYWSQTSDKFTASLSEKER